MTTGWHRQVYRLRFQLSDWTLGYKDVPVLARQLSLVETLAGEGSLPDLASLRLSGCVGLMARSLPLSSHVGWRIEIAGEFVRYVIGQDPRYFIRLSGTFEEYCKNQFSAKTRSTVQRKIRKFASHSSGQLAWKVYLSVEELQEFHVLARSISRKTYQERLFDAGLPADETFVATMKALAEKDCVRAFILFDGKSPVAYLYLPASDDVLVYEYLGYLPDYAQWSVGTILQWVALEYLFDERRFSLFDFTEGGGEHKRFFATDCIECVTVLFLPNSVSYRTLARAHFGVNRFSQLLGAALGRFGLRSRIRRFLRKGFRPLWSKSS